MKRWQLFAGVAYVALVAVALFAVPMWPEVTASGDVLVKYLQDHGTALRLTAWLGTLAVIPFVVLIADLRTRLSGIARDVMLIGAIGFVVETIVWSWFHVGLALHAATLAPATARALDDIGAYYGPVLTATMVLFIAPLGIAAWQGKAGLPKWFAWVTAVFAAEQLVETVTIFGKKGFIAPGGPMNFQLGAGLFLVWVLASGYVASAIRRVD